MGRSDWINQVTRRAKITNPTGVGLGMPAKKVLLQAMQVVIQRNARKRKRRWRGIQEVTKVLPLRISSQPQTTNPISRRNNNPHTTLPTATGKLASSEIQ